MHMHMHAGHSHTSIRRNSDSSAATAGWPLVFLRVMYFSRTHYRRNFSKIRQSTAFYYAYRTVFCAKAILSGTHLFFCVKVGKKNVEIWDPKKHFINTNSAAPDYFGCSAAPLMPLRSCRNIVSLLQPTLQIRVKRIEHLRVRVRVRVRVRNTRISIV